MENKYELEEPKERPARWMNDNDLNQVLKISDVRKLEDGQFEFTFTTSLGERVRRTTRSHTGEYAFLYNLLVNKVDVVKYVKKNGHRVPVQA